MLTAQVEVGDDLIDERGFADRGVYSTGWVVLAKLVLGLHEYHIFQRQSPEVVVQVQELEVGRFIYAADF